MSDEIDDLSVDDVLDAPLDKKRIVVTRPKDQAGKLASLLERLGADVLHVPVIEIADPPSWDEVDWSIKKLGEGFYAWVVFSSTNAVDKFFERLEFAQRDARAFGRARIAAVGAVTAERLAAHGIRPDLVPTEHTGEALAASLGRGSGRVLIPRVASAPKSLADRIAGNGWKVESVVAYTNLPATDEAPETERVRAGEFDAVTFASGSAVRGFAGMVGAPEDLSLSPGDEAGKLVACIGPSTAEAAREIGFRVDVVPQDHSSKGLAMALAAAYRSDGNIER
jgi:uroporphyrinogen III methyltransferase/synthase